MPHIRHFIKVFNVYYSRLMRVMHRVKKKQENNLGGCTRAKEVSDGAVKPRPSAATGYADVSSIFLVHFVGRENMHILNA